MKWEEMQEEGSGRLRAVGGPADFKSGGFAAEGLQNDVLNAILLPRRFYDK